MVLGDPQPDAVRPVWTPPDVHRHGDVLAMVLSFHPYASAMVSITASVSRLRIVLSFCSTHVFTASGVSRSSAATSFTSPAIWSQI